MPPFISTLISRWTADFRSLRSLCRIAPVVILHLAALVVLFRTEYFDHFPYPVGFLLAWGLLNFLWLAVLRRPAVAAMLSLAMILLLIEVSKYKLSIVFQTAYFIDLMLVDPATVSFLLALLPGLRIYAAIAVALLALALVLLWRLDVFRVPRMAAIAGVVACLGGLVGLSFSHPFEYNWFPEGHVSTFARSGVDAMWEFIRQGYMESDAVVTDRLRTKTESVCQPAGKPPHIILIHDESAFDIRTAPNMRVSADYGRHFLSFDGVQRNLIVEGLGGPSWFAEYNLLAGLSVRSFGKFAYFVPRIAAGRVVRGLPRVLHPCGYRTFSLYPYFGAFMSARNFHTTTGVQQFYDMHEMRAGEFEPDRFYYGAALRLLERERAKGPMFVYVYHSANHSPWDYRWRPELTPGWQDFGNGALADEYLRRQLLGMQDYRDFLANLTRDFPGESFLLVRYGDHQPNFAPQILDPNLSQAELAQRMMAHDPRYFTTYYAIDTVNFRPVNVSSALDTIEAPHLPLVMLEAAGVPLDPSFAEQKRIFERCRGMFYRCRNGAEARRFNRLLIDAGLIRGL